MSKIRQHGAKAGVLGTFLSTFLAMGCCGFGPLPSLVSVLGVGFLTSMNVQLPILYIALMATLGGLYGSFRRHRRPSALVLAVFSAGLVLYPFHESLDVWLFYTLLSTGLGSLLTACLWDMRLWRNSAFRR